MGGSAVRPARCESHSDCTGQLGRTVREYRPKVVILHLRPLESDKGWVHNTFVEGHHAVAHPPLPRSVRAACGSYIGSGLVYMGTKDGSPERGADNTRYRAT